jgi:hypothetical protein
MLRYMYVACLLITETECVFRSVRTKCLNVIEVNVSVKRRINNQLDSDKLRFIDVISSTCFGHHYANHQEYRSEPIDRL